MSDLFSNLLALSIAGSVVVGLMLFLRPVMVKIFPAKWQYRMGKMAIVFFLIPISFFVGRVSSVLSQTIATSHYSGTLPMATPEALQPNGFVDAMGVIERHFPMAMGKHLSPGFPPTHNEAGGVTPKPV